MSISLEYASPKEMRRDRRSLWIALEIALVTFVFSQMVFLLAMMSINIRESNVPPYHVGSSYNSNALGNADFVTRHPDFAELERFSLPHSARL